MITVEDTNGRARQKTRKMVIHCPHFCSLLRWPSIHLLFFSPLVMKVRSRASSVMSGASTPGGGKFNTLSEVDLRKADAALQNVDYHDDDEGEK